MTKDTLENKNSQESELKASALAMTNHIHVSIMQTQLNIEKAAKYRKKLVSVKNEQNRLFNLNIGLIDEEKIAGLMYAMEGFSFKISMNEATDMFLDVVTLKKRELQTLDNLLNWIDSTIEKSKYTKSVMKESVKVLEKILKK